MELAEAIERSRTIKERRVASTRGDDPGDIEPILWIGRRGRTVATVEAPGGRDPALLAAQVAARGYGADELVLAIDSHVTQSPVDPRTGEAWRPGAMKQFCDDEQGCDLGVITDCLLIARVTRPAKFHHTMLLYHVHKTVRRVVWIGEPDIPGDESNVTGLIPEGLVEALSGPDGFSVARTDPGTGHLSDQVLRARYDEATTEALRFFGFAVHPGRALP